jgi:hypothetical protein
MGQRWAAERSSIWVPRKMSSTFPWSRRSGPAWRKEPSGRYWGVALVGLPRLVMGDAAVAVKRVSRVRRAARSGGRVWRMGGGRGHCGVR